MTDAARQLELLQKLSDVTAELSQAATLEEVTTAILASGMQTLGADAGFVGRVDGDVLRVLRLNGYADVPEQIELPVDAPYPLAEAVRRAEPLFIGSNEELACNYPGLSRIVADDHACATVPLVADDRVLGALNIGFSEPRRFGADDIALVEELGRRCAQALARAQAYSDEIERRETAERALRELGALELNDDVVQQLAVAKLALDVGETDDAAAAVTQALDAAKQILARQAAGADTYRRD